MNVCVLWQRLRIDLHHGADHDEVPIRSLSCDVVEELNVEPLVDDAKKAETRMRNVRLIFGIAQRLSCFAEVGGIDTARECVHRRVLIALPLIQTLSAGENQIDVPEEFLFQQRQTRMSAFER